MCERKDDVSGGSDVTMLTYVRETPQAIVQNADDRVRLTAELVDVYLARPYRCVWVIACGSSANAAWCARPLMRKCLGHPVEVVKPATFLYSDFEPGEDTLCFVVSQSGCSTNAIWALDRLRELGRPAIGITANLDSTFRDHADLLVDYGAGTELVGFVTKGMVTLVEFLMLFSIEAAERTGRLWAAEHDSLVDQIRAAGALYARVQEHADEFLERHFKALTSMSVLYALGFDASFGTALEAALKVGETVKIPSFAYEAEEFNHGPNLQLTPSYTCFFVDDGGRGSGRLRQLYRATRHVTDRAFMISTRTDAVGPVAADTSVAGVGADTDDPCVLALPAGGAERTIAPLYQLPFFQVLAYRVSEALGTWDKHPLLARFEKEAPSKSEDIRRVMPLM
ncbi:MAG: SIS domain-containing protein [Olsenella sp.]|nr:SIS domain-containing protein [Olsenella sp.]